MASRPHLDSCAGKRTCEIQPTEIYYGNTKDLKPQIKLRIATGGAGQSGLIKALADAFIDTQVSNQCPPFAVSWIKSDTTASFNHLADGSADLSITYNAAAEKIAMAQGNADKHVYAWRDHFLFVGMHAHIVQFVQELIIQVPKTTLQTWSLPKTPQSKNSSRNCSSLQSLPTTPCASCPGTTNPPPTSKNPPFGHQSDRRHGRILSPSSTTSTQSFHIKP